MTKVIHFLRKPNQIAFSIENVFQTIRSEFPEDIDVHVHKCIYPSKGIWRRVFEAIRAAWNQGDVNHVTGDVHFLTYFMRRHRTLLTIHDCVSLERLSGIKYWTLWFFWYWLPSRRSAAITVISDSTKKELQRHIGSDNYRIVVIPNCVSPDYQFVPKPFDATCPRILQVGTTKNKNIDRVATALRGITCKLVIVGKLSSEQVECLEQNEIHYENHVGISHNEMVKQYALADVVMFASLYEGFGLPIIEANATGRPVIASNLYSMPEVGGNAACYVDPFSVDSIKDAVMKISNDSAYRSSLIENGLNNAKRFSAKSIALLYADLYRSLLTRP